jgi:GAF domain-containing protein
MTAPPDDTTTDPQSIIAALRQQVDEGLSREAALAEELAARNATFALHKTEFDERIEYQAATVDILTTMSASPGDAQPVLDLIVRYATELCNVPSATLFEYDGELVHIRSDYRSETILAPSALAAYIQLFPMHPTRGSISCRAILDRQIIHIRDLRLDPELAGFARELGHRSQVSVPLIRDDFAIGVITIGAQAAGGFSDSQVELLKTFAKQAVIAITSAETYRALEERTAALTQRNSEYSERIDQQSATIDVLQAMSASPGDPQPVFDLIVDRARDLCDAYGATVFEFDGTEIHWRAATGVSDDPAVRAAYEAQFPMVPTRGWAFGRAILDRRIISIDDMEAEPGLDPTLRGITAKSNVTTPIMRGDAVIGAIGMGSREKGGFSDSQVELLKTFAEQAAIAITSAETYRALQTRTSDLQETLEYQTAISDVLKVISRSAVDLQPVLDTVVETAAKLCDADQAVIGRREGDKWRLGANFGFPPEYEAYQRERGLFSYAPDTPSSGARVAREGRIVHVDDVAAVPGYPEASIRLGKQRTSLGVPLLRDGEVIGNIILARQRVQPFTDRQIELVSTFADQAVIAIENTRLLTEQREALEQQTATAEVLQVINASPGNLTPVFETILDKAHSLCGADLGALMTFDGEYFRAEAIHGFPEQHIKIVRRPFRPNSDHQKLILGERLVQILDVRMIDIEPGDEVKHSTAEQTDVRTLLAVPLRKDGNLLGFISACRVEIRAFTDREIALLENFAAQAVIAMENARLIAEQREALEQQTATAEVLQVINTSPGELAPVFDALLERAMRLCEAAFGSLYTYDGQHFRSAAQRGVPPAYSALRERTPPSGQSGGPATRILQTKRTVHILDVTSEEAYQSGHTGIRALVELGGARTILGVPLLKDDTILGYISIYRQEVRAFSEKQIALLENFAGQAVIAMENARLLGDLRQRTSDLQEALEQQTATAEVLQVINSSPRDLAPVFDAMLERALRLCGAELGTLRTWDGERFHLGAANGDPQLIEWTRQQRPFVPTTGDGPLARIVRGEEVVHLTEDQLANQTSLGFWTVAAAIGFRSGITVALRKDAKLLGAISVWRKNEVRAFTDKQIAVLQNFAAQAVIAMENARLITETREALEQQTATAEVLQVINSSPGDLTPVFDAILEKAHRLCGGVFGRLLIREGDEFHLVAAHGEAQWIEAVRHQPNPWRPPEDSPLVRLVSGEQIVHIPDIRVTDHYANASPRLRHSLDSGGVRTVLMVPLRKDGALLGAITASRPEIRPFSDKQIALLENFAAQAVIAMENARLLGELRTARDTAEASLQQLKTAQASLIQAEKMASLGQLTAGIAHEIKNPLNFVNNFAELSGDLLDELNDAVAGNRQAEVNELRATLQGNLAKIAEHGRRADGIVKAMLEHSRGSSGERRMVDLNALIDEALNLAYHGARAQDQTFNITLERDFAEGIAPIALAPQDMTRVFLNLFSNSFYAATRRARKDRDAKFMPTLKVTTRDIGEAVEIRVRDNGIGISADIMDKLFQPFFTTKPTGEGTGLGLSITYDIVTQQHGGNIAVASEVGEYSEFTIRLPRSL